VLQNGVCVNNGVSEKCSNINISSENFAKISLNMTYQSVTSAIGCKADGIWFDDPNLNYSIVAWRVPTGSMRVIWVTFNRSLSNVIATPPEALLGNEQYTYKQFAGF
jgi:hypothetical protein